MIKDDLLRSFFSATVYFICMVAFYIDIGQDMGAEYFLPIFIPMTAAFVALQMGRRMPLFSKGNLPPLIAGLLWSSAFPILYTYTYHEVWFRSKISYDFIVGAGIFIMLSSMAGLTAKSGCPRLRAAFFSLASFAFMVVPLAQYGYYFMVWHAISPASLMALYMTNWKESLNFLEATLSPVGIILFLAALVFVLKLMYKTYLGTEKNAEKPSTTRGVILAALFVCVTYITLVYHMPITSIAGLWKDVADYGDRMVVYGKTHAETFASFEVDKSKTSAANAPGTVILVIGESASRSYMHAFNKDFPYRDTPWLERIMEEDGFFLFKNAYAPWTQTVPCLERALTEESQYNGKDFVTSASIIDIAKKAGYTTHWYSNQGRYGEFDSIITLIAETADKHEWTDDSYTFSGQYDMKLMDFLQKVDPKANNFIVLHIMGSHIYYDNRYPKEFRKFLTKDGSGMGAAAPSYANSILYTDHFLEEVYNYAQKNFSLTAFLYFSDHGENLHISHNPDVFTFDMVRIPMFFYFSPAYRAAYPETVSILRSRKNAYFTSDLFYDTLCGLLNATPPKRYNKEEDFTSHSYKYNRENLTTLLGTKKISEDTE